MSRNRKRKETKRKLNSKGMTLIEVLVAVVIIAVVTGPILNSFLTSIRLNAKAKDKQRVTTAAQSIMEGFKAYNLQNICLQFYANQGIVLSADPANTFKLVGNVDGVYEIDPDSGAAMSSYTEVTDADGNPVLEFTENVDHKYAFVLEGVDYEGCKYDAKVELAPLQVSTVSSMTNVVTFTQNAVINDFDKDTTAVFDHDVNQDAAAFDAILNYLIQEENGKNYSNWNTDNMVNLYGFTEETAKEFWRDHFEIIDKTFVIKIQESSGAYTVDILVHYRARVNGESSYSYFDAYGIEKSVSFSTLETNRAFSLAKDGSVSAWWTEDPAGDTQGGCVYERIYPSVSPATEDASKLKTINFCYYPSYNYGAFSMDGISVPEERVCVKCWCDDGSFEVNLIKQINPNVLTVDLSVLDNNYTGRMNSDLLPAVSKFYGATVTLGGNYTEVLSGGGGTPGSSLVSTKEDVLLYDVVVSVYESGTATAGFPADVDPILVLTGSVND